MKKRLVKSLYTERWELLRRLLKEARRSAGLTQAEVAARLKRPQSLVAKIEAGERKLDVCQFMDYLDVLDTDPIPLVLELLASGRRKSHAKKKDQR